ncbi:MAG: hypothetical protein AAGA54_07720 [Myxococcota bacterium]
MRTLLLGAVLLLGCAATPTVPLPTARTRIYVGYAYGPGEATPAFRYTRDSGRNGPTLRSVHRSHARDGTVVVEQAAIHDAQYQLRRAVEHHHERGVQAEITVEPDGTLQFTRVRNGRVQRRRERASAPAVVGPTLFGFTAAHWDALASGTAVPLRFVVAEDRRSYAFTLRMTASDDDTTTIQMRADAWLVRRLVPPMTLTFDTRSRTIVRYEGRIPPRYQGRPLDARVEYEHAAPYR